MKYSIFVLLAIAFTIGLNAQTENDYLEIAREVLKTEKKAAIAEVMDLSEDESTAFWELYNEYQNELYLIQNKGIAILKDYSENFTNITDEKAEELWMASQKNKMEVLKLERKYYAKFKKILPASRVARFFQAENKIETLIDAQMALEIPLLEIKK